jgi:hypothetical protein
MRQPLRVAADPTSSFIGEEGERASYRFFEFFTANIAIRTRAPQMANHASTRTSA